MLNQTATTPTQEIVETLDQYGYRVAWVNDDGSIAHGFKGGETYPYSQYAKQYEAAKAIALILDRFILIDCDFYKWTPECGDPQPSIDAVAAKLRLNEMPQYVQSSADGKSQHFLFKLPEGFDDSVLKCSNDNRWMQYVDVKTGNQVMHIKLHKEMDLNDLDPDNVPVANQATIDILRAKAQVATAQRPPSNASKGDIEEAYKILAAIPVPSGYGDWLEVLFGIHNEFGHTATALDLADWWSAQGDSYAGRDVIAYKLDTMGSYGGQQVTWGTVAMRAAENGYDLSESARIKAQANNVYPIESNSVDMPSSSTAEHDAWDEPIDWWAKTPTPSFPAKHFPPFLKKYAAILSKTTGHDAAGYLTALLSACAAALDCRVHLRVWDDSNWYVPSTLWTLKFGRSGSGKSVFDKTAYKPLQKINAERLEVYLQDMETYDLELKQWADATKQGNLIAKPEKPMRTDFITSQCTVEALRDLLADSDRGLTACFDELCTWLDSLGKYTGGGISGDKADYLKAFDGGFHKVDRVGRPILVKNWSAGIATSTTPSALARHKSKLPPDGTLQRFLIVRVGSSKGLQVLDASGDDQRLVEATGEQYERLLRDLVGIYPCYMTLEPAAKDAFKKHHDECRALSDAYEGVSEDLMPFVAKQPDKTARVALVLHCIRHGSSAPSNRVCLEDMEAAIAITTGLHQHAVSLFDELDKTSEFKLVRDLAQSMLATGIKERCTMSQLVNCSRSFRTEYGKGSREADAAISLLIAGGWIRPEKQEVAGVFVPGKKNTFEVNPALYSSDRFDEVRLKQQVLRKATLAMMQKDDAMSFEDALADAGDQIAANESPADDYSDCPF